MIDEASVSPSRRRLSWRSPRTRVCANGWATRRSSSLVS